MDFEQDYPEATVIKLEQNYRSTKNILAAANAVIEHNVTRTPKELWPENATGEKLTSYQAMDERDEAQFITTTIMKQRTIFNASYGDIAILYRTNAQSRIIEETFMRSGIPYKMVGGLKFYDRKEIKDILAYLRVIYNPLDTVSLMRIINVPKRRLGALLLPKPWSRNSCSSSSSPFLKSSTPSPALRRASRSHSSSSRHSSSTS